MGKKTLMSAMILVILVIASAAIVSAETMTHTDATGDVLDINSENVSRPNLDIEQISAVKNGNEVELKLKLVEGGTIQTSSLTYMYGYNIILITTHEMYNALYTGLDLSSLTPEDLEGVSNEELEMYEELACFVVNGEGEKVDIITYGGEGENELSIKFNLLNSNEQLISLSAESAEQSSTQEFYDEYTGEELTINVSSLYNATTGNPVIFEGNLEEGAASEYDWIWYFEETNTFLEGYNASNIFKIPDIYDGIVYVYDSDGNYGADFFSVNVTGKAINTNGNNGSPGFEVIVLLASIAVALVLLRKRK